MASGPSLISVPHCRPLIPNCLGRQAAAVTSQGHDIPTDPAQWQSPGHLSCPCSCHSPSQSAHPRHFLKIIRSTKLG
jgi:hypothetical protein